MLDESIVRVIDALDDAKDAVVVLGPESPPTAHDEEVGVLLATFRLQITEARAKRALHHAHDAATMAAALESVAAAAETWLAEPVTRARLARMRPRDRSDSVIRRVEATAAEMRRFAAEILANASTATSDAAEVDDVARLRRRAVRLAHAAQVSLEDACMSVKHAS